MRHKNDNEIVKQKKISNFIETGLILKNVS